MKRNLTALLFLLAAFASGWFGHKVYHYDPESGVQWKFVDAARRGDTRTMEQLLRAGAKIDLVPSYANGSVSGEPALSAAADAGQSEAVKWLLDRDANPNLQISDMGPLALAESRVIAATEAVAALKLHGAKKP